MNTTKLATVWHDFAKPFDRKNPQYGCHIHGYDVRKRNTIKAALGLLILSFLTQWIGWFMPGEVLMGVAITGLVFGLAGMAGGGVGFPHCTCQTDQEEAQ